MSFQELKSRFAAWPFYRVLLAVSLVVIFASQFLGYRRSESYGHLVVHADYSTTGYYHYDFRPVGTGWQIHRFAPWVLTFLAFAYLTDLCEGRTWRRWGYLFTLGLVFLCLSPGAWTEPGFKLGLLGFAGCLVATMLNRAARKREAAAVTG